MNAGPHHACTAYAKQSFYSLAPKAALVQSKQRQNTRNFTPGSLGPFATAEDLENMTTTPETSLEVNAGTHHACTACAKQSFYSLAPKAALVQPNQGKTHAIHTWLSRAFCYCRGPRKHNDDTGDVARGQRWSARCMHCVRKAEFLLLGPKGRVGAAKPRQNTLN